MRPSLEPDIHDHYSATTRDEERFQDAKVHPDQRIVLLCPNRVAIITPAACSGLLAQRCT